MRWHFRADSCPTGPVVHEDETGDWIKEEDMACHIAALYRYPVKALTPQPLEHAVLETGGGMQGDHRYALAHGAGSTAGAGDVVTGRLPRSSLVTLNDCPKLATLVTRYIEPLNVLTVERDGRQVARGDLTMPVGRAMLEDFFSAFLRGHTRGTPRLVIAKPGETFANHDKPGVILINRSSVSDIERVVGQPVDPLRFRANLLIDGPPPWDELGWIGREIRIGSGVVLRAVESVPAHPASEVNPERGVVDLNVDKVKENPVTPGDYLATICAACGLDPAREIHDHQGRPYKICDGEPIRAILG